MNKQNLKKRIPPKYWYLLEDEQFCLDLQFLFIKNPSEMAIQCYLENWDYLKAL
jgi:hypothetical protein